MSDIIRLLPDSVSNQIAAGEVVQRPASVVKELVENALDAEASHIQIVIKDAGRTLIQIIDNGKGMSETDARMAFERHATSKITSANDLFALRTMGFRGEALASIAAVAQVELKTRRADAELGTHICISGSALEKQEDICTNPGSNFVVKNLFFNIPARRKFLKSNEREFLHILSEFQRIALVNPNIHFELVHNNIEVFNLPPSNLRQRIIKIFGKSIHLQNALNKNLLNIDVETTLAKITGFIGKPEAAKKRNDQQYFFVNGRYMRHPYFHKAVMQAYEALIPQGEMPTYFIYFAVDPKTIDINIHPTKTEIKFEDEQALWPIITAAVKETLGKFSIAPTIDFDTEGAPDIPVFSNQHINVQAPKPTFNENYNPFKTSSSGYSSPKINTGWEKLYDSFKQEKGNCFPDEVTTPEEVSIEADSSMNQLFEIQESTNQHLHYKDRYILTSVKSGLMLIDQHRAHIRILYQTYITQIKQRKGASQRVLFPEKIDLTPEEAALFPLLLNDLHYLGFELTEKENNSYEIEGTPVSICNLNPSEVIKDMLFAIREKGDDLKQQLSESLALSLAKKTAISPNKSLSNEEMQHLIDQLFAIDTPNYTPDGKPILRIISNDEIEKLFR